MKKLYPLLIALILILGGCQIIPAEDKTASEISQDLTKEEVKQDQEDIPGNFQEEDKIHEASLLFGGDILPHLNFSTYARNAGTDGALDYSDNFEQIRDFTRGYDFFLANNEFTCHPDLPLSGYPTFNVSKDIYTSLKDIGISGLTTANNHALDTGIQGLESTLLAIRENNMANIGSQLVGEKPYLISEVNGIKVGILAYTQSLNGLDFYLDSEEKKSQINTLDEDLVKTHIGQAIGDGADFIVVCPHWGNEYQSMPTEDQVSLARNMIEWGADLVIGSHPHVIQPKETYQATDGREGLIYYSLGNLISNQALETLNDYRVEQGLLVEVSIQKSSDEDKARITQTLDHPTWMGRQHTNQGILNQVYLVDEYLGDGPKAGTLDQGKVQRMQKAKEMTETTLNSLDIENS